jgi:HD superfamily phosphohydrolase
MSSKRAPDDALATRSSDSKNKRNKTQKNVLFVLRKLPGWERHMHTNDEIYSSVNFTDPVMKAILDTPPMQRLRGLKQLGTAEYVYMNANHNRFEHSVGVAHLADRLARKIAEGQPQLGCTEMDILCVKLAGLLHDIGHGPFSHTYEDFVKTTLEKHTDLPPLPPKWGHEMVSLQMIDAVLEHLALRIDFDHLDEPLQQIQERNGVDAHTMCAKDNVVMTSRDFVFIKECIWGGPLPGQTSFIGRTQMEKEWLYDIVNNRHSGLDVDKVDYYARDKRRAFRGSGEVDNVMIEEAVVAWAECTDPHKCVRCQQKLSSKPGMHLMICYPEKTVKSAITFFRERFELHTFIYKHKTGVAVGK